MPDGTGQPNRTDGKTDAQRRTRVLLAFAVLATLAILLVRLTRPEPGTGAAPSAAIASLETATGPDGSTPTQRAPWVHRDGEGGTLPFQPTTVLVLDPGDQPVAGAHVRPYDPRLGAADEHETTGADGRGVVRPRRSTSRPFLPRQSDLALVEADGFVPQVVAVQGGADHPVRLVPGGVLAGQVTDDVTGEPRAGIVIAILVDPGRELRVTTQSDASGQYRLAGVPPGRQVLWASPPGELPQRFFLELTGRAEQRLELRLEPGRAVAFTFENLETHAPVPAAELASDDSGWHARADGQGRLRVALGHREPLRARAEGYADTWVQLPADPDHVGPIRVGLLPDLRIEGRVLFPADRPQWLARATVTAEVEPMFPRNGPAPWKPLFAALGAELSQSFQDPRTPPSTRTDADGRFRLRGIATWRNGPAVRLRASAPGSVAVRSEPLALDWPGGQAAVELRLVRAGRLEGQVRDGEQPVRARVTLDAEHTLTTGEHGTFEFADLPPGQVTIEATRLDRPFLQARTTVPIVADQITRQYLELPLRFATISGRVADDLGAGIAAATVHAIPTPQVEGMPPLNTHTHQDGSYEVEVPADQSRLYQVVAWRRPARSARDRILADTRGVDFVLPRTGRVRVRLFDPDRTPARWADVRWRPHSGSEQDYLAYRHPKGAKTLDAEPDGAFTFELPVGSVDLELRSVGFLATVSGAAVTADAQPEPIQAQLVKTN